MIYALDLRADDLQHLLLDLIALGGRDEQPHGAIVVDDALPQLDSRKLAHLEVRRSAPALIDAHWKEGDDMNGMTDRATDVCKALFPKLLLEPGHTDHVDLLLLGHLHHRGDVHRSGIRGPVDLILPEHARISAFTRPLSSMPGVRRTTCASTPSESNFFL